MTWLKNKIILRTSLSLIVAFAILFASFIVLLNLNVNSAVEQTITNNGIKIAEGFTASIDVHELESFLSQPVENELYWSIRDDLNAYREQIGATYVYITQLINDTPYIMIDGQPENSDVASPIMEEAVIEDEHHQLLVKGQSVATGVTYDELYGTYVSSYAPIIGSNGQLLAILGIDVDVEDVQAVAIEIKQDNVIIYLVFLLFAAVIIAILISILIRSLRPLTWINESARLITNSQFNEADRILKDHPVRSNNEVGQLYESVNKMSTSISQLMRDLVGSVQGTAEQLAGAVDQMNQRSDELLKANASVQQGTSEVVQATGTQRRSSSELSQTMEEMSIAISRISDASTSVAESSKVALDHALHGQGRIDELRRQMEQIADSNTETNEKMERLQQSSQRIDEAVQLITGVASQTKLLAFNAAIEAARAGEHGRGFAVVANEVRKLADDVYNSASDIQGVLLSVQDDISSVHDQVNHSHEEVRQGEQMSAQVNEAIHIIVKQFENVSEQMDDISSSTEEVSASTEEVTAVAVEISGLATTSAENAVHIEKQASKQNEVANHVSEVSKQLSLLTERLKEAISRIQV